MRREYLGRVEHGVLSMDKLGGPRSGKHGVPSIYEHGVP